ncbi:MAG TPA: hypothetical protein VMY37_02325 [Thermoguttaceae bacterium]|nr:hypothetical protein [Thermoguttaceae bacterium]
MPPLLPKAIERIGRAVRVVERWNTENAPPASAMPEPFRWLQLTENLDANDEADANPGTWNPSTKVYAADTGRTYTVHDPHGNAEAVIGSWVLCQPRGVANGSVWEIVSVANRDIWGKLDDALAYNGTATVSIWSDDLSEDTGVDVEGVKPPPSMTASGVGPIASDSWVRIRRRADGVWYVDHALAKKTVVTSLQFASGKLQKKTTDVLVFVAGTESAWVDIDGQSSITTEDVLTDFQVSGLTLQTKSRSVYVNPAAAETDWVTEHTGTECS